MSHIVQQTMAARKEAGLTKEEMQRAKFGSVRRAVSVDMTYHDRRDHYQVVYNNKMVCAPGFKVDRKTGGLSYKVGDYYLSEVLGRGAGGSVYEGRHRLSNERVAVKVVTKSRSEEARLVASGQRKGQSGEGACRDAKAEAYAKKMKRSRQEYTVMTHVRNHRNIARLHDVVENDKAICIVMELGPDGDLFQRIQSKGRLPLVEAWGIFRQLVAAVAHLHAQGFVHRDIKPENCVFDGDRLMLCDFGFADMWCSFKQLNEGVGSLNYCSPEVVTGSPYTGPEIDMWSIGACLYAMTTGNLPFAAESPKQVVQNIRRGKVGNLGGREVDPLLDDLLTKLLATRSIERATMADVMNHRWFRQGPRSATPARALDCRKRAASVTNSPITAHRTRIC